MAKAAARPTIVRRGGRRRKTVTRTRVSSQTTLRVNAAGSGASAGTRLGEAAENIADGIRARAAEFSVKIPPSVSVDQASTTTATVSADAPNAYPIETGARHPLFGNRNHWYPMKQILFMEEGAGNALDKAAETYGYGTINDWLKEVDW
jgi:hypothetical protein